MPANDDWLTGGNRREQAAAAIHAAARAELVDRGIDRFSVERVAARAGCSRATLYRIVGGKGALLRAVLADGAARVAERVRVATAGLEGEARVVEAILVAVDRIRADPTIAAWIRRGATGDDRLPRSDDLTALAADLTGSAAPHAGDWIVRVVLSLVVWPATDPATERALVTSYVGPAFG